MPINVFVIGLDEINLDQLSTVRNPADYAFHGLVPCETIVNPSSYPMEEIMGIARRELDAFPGTVDAIIGHWDFPTTSMLPILRRERGLPGPTLESVLYCESKYWGRMAQREAVPECTPAFQGVDPYADDPWTTLELEPPEAEKLALQTREGSIYLVLRNPLEEEAPPPEVVEKPKPRRVPTLSPRIKKTRPQPFAVEVYRGTKRDTVKFKDPESGERQ